MGMFDEVLCNHELFGVHKGETKQTKDLHWLGGLLDNYEITPSGRLEFLEYTVEDRSDPTLEGIERLFDMMTKIFTGGRRDLDYHGWLYLSCFGRAKFTDGALVAFEPEPDPRSRSEQPDEAHKAAQTGEGSGAECDPVPESRMGTKRGSEVAVIGKRFRSAELPGLYDLEAFVEEISSEVRSKLAWRLNKSLGLNTNAIRELLDDRSIADEWTRFERESE